MELVLNLAWALCSAGLFLFWVRRRACGRIGGGAQLLALAMVVLLLLPVISLSDDLVAAQGPAETDTTLRRVMERGQVHPSVVPLALGLPELLKTGHWPQLVGQVILHNEVEARPSSFHSPSRFSRPPPQA